MKLYVWNIAPNPRRVCIYLIEKGIEVPMEEVGVPGKPILDPAFLEKAPHRRVPVLELDDGTLISEAMAICRYFETQYPEPPLMGADPLEMALVEMWERMSEFEGLLAVAESFRNAKRSFAGRAPARNPGGIGPDSRADRARQAAGRRLLRQARRPARRSPFSRRRPLHRRRYHGLVHRRLREVHRDRRDGSPPDLARWREEVAGRESIRATA